MLKECPFCALEIRHEAACPFEALVLRAPQPPVPSAAPFRAIRLTKRGKVRYAAAA